MKNNKFNFLKTTSGIRKLMFCLILSIATYFLLCFFKLDVSSRIILGWDTFCISMTVMSWALFFTTSSKDLFDVVEKQDDGIEIIFAIVLVAICFSLFGTLIILGDKNETVFNIIIHTIISLSPIFLSWILLHTIFAIRYAHLFNDHNKLNAESNTPGLEFPVDTQPDYIDFAYFSFVIGMTFQVSDITINSKMIRRFVLMHSLISFVFNTIIVALTINTIAGIKQ